MALRLQAGFAHPCPLDIDSGDEPVVITSHAHLVASSLQAGEQSGVDLSSGNAPGPDGDVGSVPTGALAPYLYLQPDQSRWCVHNRGTEVTANVEHDGPHFACPGEMVHDYGATEMGVAAGFL